MSSLISYNVLPLAGCTPEEQIHRLRLNSFGSLYYFIKNVLRRKRLTQTLHEPICKYFEKEHIKDVVEVPRDHFKSTISSEGLPIWWALPLMQKDLDDFTQLGYPDEFIKYLIRHHDPGVTNLLVSENITNAAKLGSRIRWHFESNAIYRSVFPETLPTSQDSWSTYSLCVNRKAFGTSASHGEGTFDFLGVGGALQSRHYKKMVQDDLVGRKAIESPSIMEKTIDYHKLIVGAFEQEDKDHENDELVIGNRWSFHDLNSHIREHETWFNFTSHSALGGCCGLHPADTPIFPEEFSVAKLLRIKERQGAYHFSCQYLNNPSAPEDADFREDWLGFYSLEKDARGRLIIQHEARNGTIKKDIMVGHLTIAMAVDPNHSGNAAAGRCRHALVVVGKSDADTDREYADHYLLDGVAFHSTYQTFIDGIYRLCDKWKLYQFGLETIAAQIYLKNHIDSMNLVTGRRLRIIELKGEVEAPDGTLSKKKEWRIRNVLSPIFESGHFYVQRTQQDFIGEYNTFPKGRFVDLLDALAYIPGMVKHSVSSARSMLLLQKNQERAANINKPYTVGVN